MAYATAYSNLIHTPQNLDYTVKFDWLEQTAKKRSQLDEMAYNYIDDLRNKALNIRFLNKAGQAKVDEYNNEVESFFKNTDLNKLDLADYNTVNNYTKIFDKLTSDQELVKAYQVDKQIQSTWNTWRESAKNPSKTGFSEANYIVWQNEHLLPYMNENNLSNLSMFNSGTYDPKYDYMKELKGLKSQVHFDGKKFEVLGNDGSKQTYDIQELTSEKLQTFFKGALSNEATQQIMKEAKSSFYKWYNNVPDNQRDDIAKSLYETDKQRYDEIKIKTDKKIAELEGEMLVSSPDEKLRKQQAIDELKNQSRQFTFNRTLDDYTSLSKVGLANEYGKSHTLNKIKNLADGMAYQVKKISNGLNENYWKRQDFNFKVNQEQYDRNRDLVKDQQWQMNYDLNVSKFKHDVEEDAVKNALKDQNVKVSQKSNGFFSGIVEGDAQSGVITIDDINSTINSLNSQLKQRNPNELTREEVNSILINNDGSLLSNTIRNIALINGYNGEVSDKLLGIIKGNLKNELEHGNLHEYFNELNTKKQLYQNIKDKTWNEIMNQMVYTQNPELKGKDETTIQKFFNNNPSLAKRVKELWNSKLTSNMNSIKANNFIVDLDKDKNTHSRNLDMITSIANSDKSILNSLSLPENTVLTKDMISQADYSPLTGKMNIVLKDNIDKENTRGLNGRKISVNVPTSIRNQFNIDVSDKDKLGQMQGYYDGVFKNTKYRISRDFNNSNKWFMRIEFPDGKVIDTSGGYIDGKYQPGNSVESDSIDQMEAMIKETINKRNNG